MNTEQTSKNIFKYSVIFILFVTDNRKTILINVSFETDFMRNCRQNKILISFNWLQSELEKQFDFCVNFYYSYDFLKFWFKVAKFLVFTKNTRWSKSSFTTTGPFCTS